MKRLRLVSEGILYRNPHPGHQAVCAFLPNLVPLSDQELLCFYRRGQAFYSLDGTLAQLRSEDGGNTWIDEGLIWDPTAELPPYTYSAPHGTLLQDGSLVIVAHRYPATEENFFRFNLETGGAKTTETVLFRSQDGGRHWSAPQPLELGSERMLDTPSSVIEMEDGRWFLAFEQWKMWDDVSPLHIKGFALYSRDQGETWGEREDFPTASDPARMYSHSRYSRMLDGRICALQWTQNIGGQKKLPAPPSCVRYRWQALEYASFQRNPGPDKLARGPWKRHIGGNLFHSGRNQTGSSGSTERRRGKDLGS